MNWLKYFEHNRDHRAPIPWATCQAIAPRLRKAFVRSLQKFQIGESGEGRHLRKLSAATGDEQYAQAMELFIREEQRHAELMAGILTRLNAPLLKSDWTDNCFVLMRHMSGLHTELLVLLLPEMIAKVYFDTLRKGFSNPAMNAVFTQIFRDEEGHLAFHADYLNKAFAKMSFPRRIVVQVVWRFVYRAVCALVYLDHGSLLRALGVGPARFWRECGAVFDEVAAKIFCPAHVLVRPELVVAITS
jgi:rubrerythrin